MNFLSLRNIIIQGPGGGHRRMGGGGAAGAGGGRFHMYTDGPLRPIRPEGGGIGGPPTFPSHDRNFENFLQASILLNVMLKAC